MVAKNARPDRAALYAMCWMLRVEQPQPLTHPVSILPLNETASLYLIMTIKPIKFIDWYAIEYQYMASEPGKTDSKKSTYEAKRK